MEDLVSHLKDRIHLLNGEWLSKKSSYDGDICRELGMQEDNKRYWDAKWNGYFLEFKKGRSIWIDLVRYSETFLIEKYKEADLRERIGELPPYKLQEAPTPTITLFFLPYTGKNKPKHITEILVVNTSRLIQKLCVDEQIATQLINLDQTVPKGLNAQASLSPVMVREIAYSKILHKYD